MGFHHWISSNELLCTPNWDNPNSNFTWLLRVYVTHNKAANDQQYKTRFLIRHNHPKCDALNSIKTAQYNEEKSDRRQHGWLQCTKSPNSLWNGECQKVNDGMTRLTFSSLNAIAIYKQNRVQTRTGERVADRSTILGLFLSLTNVTHMQYVTLCAK